MKTKSQNRVDPSVTCNGAVAAACLEGRSAARALSMLLAALIKFIDRLGNKSKNHLTLKVVVYLNWMEDGLQHRENITEKEVPGLCQRVE